jgi:F-type H+-transporting ATPase subunit a
MPEHEPWLTALFNDHLAGVANGVLALFGQKTVERPWSTALATEILVVAIIVLFFAFLRSRLSMDRPGKLQQSVEVIYDFLYTQSEEQVGRAGPQHLVLFGTLFIFILCCNLIGVIPAFESPTMFPEVPLGCALVTLGYYNFMGVREHGVGKYLAHFAGPIWWMAPLMIPIEIVSHLARPLSLTVRLFANMYAGEQVTLAFLGVTYLVAPAIFMGLHVFVSFLQAYIFALMAMMYVNGAVAHDH